MRTRSKPLLLLAILLLMLSGAAFAKGRLGFGVQMATDGAASMTLKEVKISDIRANGNAFKQSLGSIKQGEHLKLVVLRGGKPMPIDIVAGADQ